LWELLVVLAEAAVAPEPGEGSLDDPAFWQHLKTWSIAAFYDVEAAVLVLLAGIAHAWAIVGAVRENNLQATESVGETRKQLDRPGFVLEVGGVYGQGQQEAKRVDQNVALTSRYLLAGIIAADPPFSVVLTL